jgi:hypothetical protein
MPRLSLSKAWDETRRILPRDGRLLATVAVALIALPTTVQALVTPPTPAGQLPEPGAWMIVAVVALIIGIIGQLAIVRLALGPHTSVGEAIGHGARRVPVYLAAVLIWVAPLVAIVMYLLLALRGTEVPPGVAIAFFAMILVLMFLAVRLIALPAVASAEGLGPLATIRRSWDLSSGNWWRLFAFLAMFVIGAMCLLVAVTLLVGSAVALVSGAPEPMSVGTLITTLVTQVAIAAASAVYFVMLTRVYVQLAGPAEAEASVPTTGT